MSDFVVRGIDRQKYMRFRAVLTGNDKTLAEWLEPLMDEVLSLDEVWQAHNAMVNADLQKEKANGR